MCLCLVQARLESALVKELQEYSLPLENFLLYIQMNLCVLVQARMESALVKKLKEYS